MDFRYWPTTEVTTLANKFGFQLRSGHLYGVQPISFFSFSYLWVAHVFILRENGTIVWALAPNSEAAI